MVIHPIYGNLPNDTKTYPICGQVVDTTRVFPHPDKSWGVNGPKYYKLRDLAKVQLNREIQKQGAGHAAREDALAALDLMKMKLL